MMLNNCPICGCEKPCMCHAPVVTSGGYTLEQAKASVGRGWGPLLDVLFFALDFYPNAPEVTTVKEKFGSLSVYPATYNVLEKPGWTRLDVETLLWTLRTVSEHICEYCGKPGEIDRSHNWLKTLCPECKKERYDDDADD